jgi:hypothetical protein
MTTAQQLANRLREVILNGTWIANTNYKAQLEGLDYRIANTKVSELNTLAILAQHIHYYIHGIINVFEHNTLEIRDKYSFDFPPITSQQQWERILNTFWTDTEILASYIEQLSDNDLQKSFVDQKYGSYLRNIDGMIEHSYYHLGQISLIKKMISINS